MRRCEYCGASLEGRRKGTRYCDAAHRAAARRARMPDPFWAAPESLRHRTARERRAEPNSEGPDPPNPDTAADPNADTLYVHEFTDEIIKTSATLEDAVREVERRRRGAHD